MKRLCAFDLDGTLALSKQAIEPPMAAALAGLLNVAEVAIISGGDWPQFETQVVARMLPDAALARLWIMPTTGAKLYRFVDAEWRAIYADDFSASERADILAALDRAVGEMGLRDKKTWGEQIDDRGTQITFSGLGQTAPLDAKTKWDPDFAKRKSLQGALQKRLPELSINVGGSTSVDITRKGVDKGWGLNRLAEQSGISLSDMLFVGDAIYPGGNDYPAKAAGVDSVAVRHVAETLTVIATATFCISGR